ncbi:Detected protein of unknown function [Hibiscus syriacus]|uniref:Bromo domain-containing protein n=2 Tax=Hibiscus syriacus TaxID=106335 RepID=A0A6A2ZD59_HIBSY|nr:Detected protein of unknown function [Hibiscus syriacus]
MGEDNKPENKIRRQIHGRKETDRENHSVNESNFTVPKEKSPGTGPEEVKFRPDEYEMAKVVQSMKPAGGDSCNGSSGSVAKESAENSGRVDPRETGESPESMAESKGEEPNRESSDVQSTASLSVKENKNAEPYNEELEQSPAIKEVSAESGPLIELLEIFRSHKVGSLFERRLEIQEDYHKLIRQHLDLETIRIRLEDGRYSGCKSKFFRDLLLLLSNAIVFFGKQSSEFAAVVELRQLVSKEIAAHVPNSNLLPKEQSSTLPESQITWKPEPELSHSLTMKTKLSVPLIACRKRSSIAAKSSSSSGQEKKRQPISSLMNEKPALDWKQDDKSTEKAEETLATKKRTRERSASGARKANKDAKALNNTKTSKSSDSITTASKGGSSSENSESKGESKVEKEKTNTNVSLKKRSAANFLNRMRSNGELTEMISADNGKGGDAGGRKKSSGGKGDQQKDGSSKSRTRSGGKRRKEKGGPVKRSTGRPPKGVVAPSPAGQSGPGKRVREAVENYSGSGHAKKRSKK